MEMTYASWLSVYIAVRVAHPCTAMGGTRHKSSLLRHERIRGSDIMNALCLRKV